MKYYLAYGSNTPIEMEDRCPGSTFLGTVTLSGYELVFCCKYATVKKNPAKSIKVFLYQISEDDERSLDLYEGYPALYTKRTVKINFEGNEISALIYIISARYSEAYSFPSQDYLFRCAQGYKSAGINIDQLIKALSLTARKILTREVI